jgi:hypothetical protein
MTDKETQEALAKLRAEQDQANEQMKMGAQSVARFHRELVEGGMERSEATQLTIVWLQQMLATANDPATGILKMIAEIMNAEEDDDASKG